MNFKIEVTQDEKPSTLLPHTAEAADPYEHGDAYDIRDRQPEWALEDISDLPYLRHIKTLTNAWRPLLYLADFMEVGATRVRWSDLKGRPKERENRASKTEITLVEYTATQHSTTKIESTHITSDSALKEALWLPPGQTQSGPSKHRIFIVEDLSRQVIEQLGSRFDIDPMFFRQQVDDYNWYNTRDPWTTAPSLLANMSSRKWFRLRSIRLRYHQNDADYQQARQDSNGFNVLRRVDNDENHWRYLDKPGSIVSITRTRTSIWVGKDGDDMIGIVLVDPTVKAGSSLWHGPTNWLLPPSSKDLGMPKPLSGGSLYENIIQATLTYPWFTTTPAGVLDHHMISKPTAFTICAEWLIVCDYVKARLGQIEWELEKPSVFRSKGDVIEASLTRLHTWRRVLPMFREMVLETVESALPAAIRLTATPGNHDSTLDDIVPDFERIQRTLNELQHRVDRLTSVTTAEISTEDSRRGLEENHNLARLTWLATTFIPLSFVTGLFSMQSDISEMRVTFGWYFAAAIPLTMVVLVVAGGVGKGWLKSKKKGNGNGTSIPMSKTR